jgi:hypothetical protein
MEGARGASYAMVQHSPSYMRIVAARLGHARTQRSARLVGIITRSEKKCVARGELNQDLGSGIMLDDTSSN